MYIRNLLQAMLNNGEPPEADKVYLATHTRVGTQQLVDTRAEQTWVRTNYSTRTYQLL